MANAEEQQQQAKKKSNLGLMLALVLVLAVAGGGAWWFLFRKAVPKTEAASETGEVAATLHLDTFVVNLADVEGNHYLRAGIDLGLEAAPKAEKGGGEGDNPFNGPVRDAIVEVLSGKQSDAILSADGKAKLKEELLAALNQRVPQLKVKKIYFTEFLVQR